MRLLSLPFFAAIALGAAACGQAGNPVSSSSTHTDDTTTDTGGTGGGSSTTTPTGTGGGGTGVPFKVMTWNTHNFFDDQKNSGTSQEIVYSKSDYEDHVAVIAKVIKSLDPDVIMLQEVENLGVLADLDKELGGAYFARQLFEGNDPRGIDIGILSKIKIDESKSHAADRFNLLGTQTQYSYARDCLEAHLTVNGRHLALLGVHFRSKGGEVASDDPDKRLAEAQHTRAIADEILAKDPTAGVVVLGDFNDSTGSQAQKAVLADKPPFVDVATTAPDPWSFVYQGEQALLDHMIASPVLAGVFVDGSVIIQHSSDQKKASDHAPVQATFSVR
jgi:endonuclease/exonuclease/phosphatase family metal-dependent hydrolase